MHFIQIEKLKGSNYKATHVLMADEDANHYNSAGCSTRGSLSSIMEDIDECATGKEGELNLIEVYGKDDFSVWMLEVPYTFIQNKLEKGVSFTGDCEALTTYLETYQASIGCHELLNSGALDQDETPDFTMLPPS